LAAGVIVKRLRRRGDTAPEQLPTRSR